MINPLRIGVVGCGAISGIYLENLTTFRHTRVTAVADLDADRARVASEQHGVPHVMTTSDLLACDEVDLVLNLTTPQAHASIAAAALEAGKHVYNEKPLTICLDEGRALRDRAQRAGLRLGAAPDTFLGAGLQTCRHAIDRQVIGEVVAGTAFMTCRGHESWHPDPAFYYQAGGGPLFDMGPYYLTALVAMLGPVRRVTGSARRSFATRTISSEPKAGEQIAVEVPTHAAAVLDFASGPVVSMIMSFDIHAAQLPIIELYGSEGTLSVPDPNTFGGEIRLFRPDAPVWDPIEREGRYPDNSRGLGVADIAAALIEDRPHRAGGDLAYHVLEVMHAVHTASDTGRHVDIESTCDRPAPLPDDWEA
jgi:predicted dehydrogenase